MMPWSFEFLQISDSKLIPAPYSEDSSKQLITPFDLFEWIENNKKQIDENGCKELFGDGFKSEIKVFGGNGRHEFQNQFETFFLQIVCHLNSPKIKLKDKQEMV